MLTVESTIKYKQNEDDLFQEQYTMRQIVVLDAKTHKLDSKVLSCNYWEGGN